MDELKEMQARIRVLEDIEAIKKLKARYLLYVDKKLWNEVANCFTENAILTMWQSRKEILENLPILLQHIITVHQGHHSDIEIISDTTAKAIWSMSDKLQNTLSGSTLQGYGFYEDEYVKENGQWKIKSSKITRILVQEQRTSQTDSLDFFKQLDNKTNIK